MNTDQFTFFNLQIESPIHFYDFYINLGREFDVCPDQKCCLEKGCGSKCKYPNGCEPSRCSKDLDIGLCTVEGSCERRQSYLDKIRRRCIISISKIF